MTNYRAVIQHDGEWWIGWIEEIAGVNSQGRTREELLENLRSALQEAIEMNRQEAIIDMSMGEFLDLDNPSDEGWRGFLSFCGRSIDHE